MKISEMLIKNEEAKTRAAKIINNLDLKQYWIKRYIYSKVDFLINEIEDKIKETYSISYAKLNIEYELVFDVFKYGFFKFQRGESLEYEKLSFINPETGGMTADYYKVGTWFITSVNPPNEKCAGIIPFLKEKEKQINEILKAELDIEYNNKIINKYINGDLI